MRIITADHFLFYDIYQLGLIGLVKRNRCDRQIFIRNWRKRDFKSERYVIAVYSCHKRETSRHADRLHLTRALKHLSLVAGDSAVCTSCFRYFSNRCSFEIVENFEHRRMGFQGCSIYRGSFPKGSHPFHSLQSRSFRE